MDEISLEIYIFYFLISENNTFYSSYVKEYIHPRFKIFYNFLFFRKRKALFIYDLVENKICYYVFPMKSNILRIRLILIVYKQKNISVVCNENLNVRTIHVSFKCDFFSSERVKLISFRLKRSNTISFK